MNIITPMNCVNQMSGVKEDHTGHNSVVKLQDKYGEMFEYWLFKIYIYISYIQKYNI